MLKKITLIFLCLSLFSCSANETVDSDTNTELTGESESITETVETDDTLPSKDSLSINENIENSEDGGHAIEVTGEVSDYSNIAIYKTGDSQGDEADFYGENAAVYASENATLNLSEMYINTDGTHANGVFSYGEGTTVNISESFIETVGNCSGGIMTTGGGTMNASNLSIHTTGNSSAAIRSDRGGGTVVVDEGSYVTEGKGSPAIYSTADITVNNAYLESKSAQGIVVEGHNSVTLNNVNLLASNISKNSDKSDYYQAVMIYQSMSGDASEGVAEFALNDSSLTNNNGDIFFVNNTVAEISISNSEIINNDENGVFLRAEAAGWGNDGSNGGHVNMYLDSQNVDGDMLVDDISSLNLYLKNNSTFTGAINSDNSDGDIYVELEEGSKWILTGDSYISSLSTGTDNIELNGYKLYVDGIEYTEGEESNGEAIEINITSNSFSMPEGMPQDKPDGERKERPNANKKDN